MLLTAGLYAPSLGYPYVYEDLNDPTRWADPMPLSVFEHLRWGAGGRVLSSLTFLGGRALSGVEPWGHHVVSIALHLLNAALLYALVRRVVMAWAAVFVVGVFLLHPVQVESVAYLSARPDLVSTCCVLLALLSLERRWYLAAWGACVAAVLSKETAIAAFLLVPLWALWRGQRSWTLAAWAGAVALPVAIVARWFPPSLDVSGAARTVIDALGLSSLWIVPMPLAIDHDWQPWRIVAMALVVLIGGWHSRVVRAMTVWVVVGVAPRFGVPLLEGLHEHHLYPLSIGLSLGVGLLLFGKERYGVRVSGIRHGRPLHA